MSSIHWYLTAPIKRQHVQYAMLYSFENARVLAISATRKHIKHLRRHHTKRARRNCPLNCMRLFHAALLLLTSYISDWCETMIFTNKHQTQKHCQSNKVSSCIFDLLKVQLFTMNCQLYSQLRLFSSVCCTWTPCSIISISASPMWICSPRTGPGEEALLCKLLQSLQKGRPVWSHTPRTMVEII